MKAGRALDKLVAVEVMDHGFESYIPHYSTDISAAWEVVEKLMEKKFSDGRPEQQLCLNGHGAPKWQAWFHPNTETLSFGDTAPHAICLSALKAVGYDG